MPIKVIFSILANIITLVAFLPYIQSIRKSQTTPHVFSWIIWGITTLIAFAIQWTGGGGVGAWPIGLSGIITLLIAILAYVKKGDITITPLDWIFFIGALATLPFWYITADPFLAIVLITLIDLLGFLPTIRKCYTDPHSENLTMYILIFFRNLLAIAALEHLTPTTLFFPTAMSIAIILMLILIQVRKNKIN